MDDDGCGFLVNPCQASSLMRSSSLAQSRSGNDFSFDFVTAGPNSTMVAADDDDDDVVAAATGGEGAADTQGLFHLRSAVSP
jgi:hypothetical protein